jgi:hypothetical protein
MQSMKQAAARIWKKFDILTLVHENHEVPHLHAWTDLCSQPVPAGERTGASQDQSLYSHEA